jgi:hypothetical protein
MLEGSQPSARSVLELYTEAPCLLRIQSLCSSASTRCSGPVNAGPAPSLPMNAKHFTCRLHVIPLFVCFIVRLSFHATFQHLPFSVNLCSCCHSLCNIVASWLLSLSSPCQQKFISHSTTLLSKARLSPSVTPPVNKDEWTLVPDKRSNYNTLDEGFHHGISYLALADHRASIVLACRKTCIEAHNLWMRAIEEIRTFGKYSDVFFDRLCPRRWRPFIQTIISYKVEDERTKFPLRLPNLKNFHVIADVNDIPRPCDLVKATLPGLSDAVHAKVRGILMAMALLGFAIPLRITRFNFIIAVQSCSNDAKFLEKLYQDCELSCHPTLDSPLGPSRSESLWLYVEVRSS